MKLSPMQLQQLFSTWSGLTTYGGKPLQFEPRSTSLDWACCTLGNYFERVDLRAAEVEAFRKKILAIAHPQPQSDLFNSPTISVAEIAPIVEKLAEAAINYYKEQEIRSNYEFWGEDVDFSKVGTQDSLREFVDCYTPAHELQAVHQALSELNKVAITTAIDASIEGIMQDFNQRKAEISRTAAQFAEKVDRYYLEQDRRASIESSTNKKFARR